MDINTLLGRTYGGEPGFFSIYKGGITQGFYYGNASVSGETVKSAFSNGYIPPYSWILSPDAGGLSSINIINGSATFTISSLALGKALESIISGAGGFSSTPSLSALTQLAATIVGTGSVSSSMQATLSLAANLAGSGSLSASLNLLSSCVASLSGSSSVTGVFTGYANMDATIYVNQATATTAELAAAVWNALAVDFNSTGTMGEIMNSVLTENDLTKIADIVLRRTTSNIEGSANGDALSLRSLYGMIAQAVHKTTVSSNTLTVTKSDDSTTLGTRTVTTDSEAEPIIGLDTN